MDKTMTDIGIMNSEIKFQCNTPTWFQELMKHQ